MNSTSGMDFLEEIMVLFEVGSVMRSTLGRKTYFETKINVFWLGK